MRRRRSDISIVVTELANNVLTPCWDRRNCFFVRWKRQHRARLSTMIVLDRVPAFGKSAGHSKMECLDRGTAGQGLGAVERLSDLFPFTPFPARERPYSAALSCLKRRRVCLPGLSTLPMTGEIACGDSYLVIPGNGRSLYMMVDGLGHGAIAAEAALEAEKAVQASSQESLTEIMTLRTMR